MARLTLPIICFYGLSFAALSVTFYLKKFGLLLSLVVSMAVVLVASEFWEVPIFVAGLLGVAYWFPYPSLAFLLHHIYTFGIFACLLYISKARFSKKEIGIVALCVCVNSLLLLPKPLFAWFVWVARIIGIVGLSWVVINGSSLVRT